MNWSPKYFDPETLAKIQPLALRSRILLEGYLAGLHRSPRRGQSVEFAEHREYAPGDDIRHVDWKVYARTDKYYLKQFEDETNLIVAFVLDGSESMNFRSNPRGLTKFEYAQLTALSLAYLVLDQRDAVAFLPFADGVEAWLPPSNQPQRWHDMVQLLERSSPSGRVSLGTMLGATSNKLNRRALVIVLSDFLDELDPIYSGARHLKYDGHDLCFLQILDEAELSFPYSVSTRFLGLEGMPDETADPLPIREAYLAELQSHLSLLHAFCHQSEIDYQRFITNSPLSTVLPSFLGRRRTTHRQGRSYVGG